MLVDFLPPAEPHTWISLTLLVASAAIASTTPNEFALAAVEATACLITRARITPRATVCAILIV